MGVKDRFFNPKRMLNFNGKIIDLREPKVMGILNITPDSFYSESRTSFEEVVNRCGQMIENGADIIDIGGYSSRPGADEVSMETELDRVIPALSKLSESFPDIPISIDTFRKDVAEQAIQAGAFMINDISGGNMDLEMASLVTKHNIPYVLMHMRGTPKDMQDSPYYSNVTEEVVHSIRLRLDGLRKNGANQVIIDPGFGFGKTLPQNYHLLSQLDQFESLKAPILVGFSRKSMIYKLLGTDPANALNGTSVLNTLALEKGAKILRVHDVREAAECIKIWLAYSNRD